MSELHSNYFQTRFSPHPSRKAVWKVITAYLQRFIPKDSILLELGAAYCQFINQIQAKEKHAYDCWENLTIYADPAVQTHIAKNLKEAALPSEYFDVIFASNFLEHLTLDEGEELLEVCRRILKPTGRLILLQPNFRYAYKGYFDDFTHRSIYTHHSLKDLVTCHGFRTIHTTPRFLPLSFKSRLPKPTWMVWIYLRLPYRPLAGQMLLVAEKSGR